MKALTIWQPWASLITIGAKPYEQPVNAFDIVHEFGGQRPNDSDRDEDANFAWPITDINVLTPPIEAKGAQGFWDWGGSP